MPATAQQIEAALRERAIPARREHAEGYMPTALKLLGVPVPGIRAVLKETMATLRGADQEAVVTLAWDLHRGGTHEGRQLAYELLGKHPATRRDLDGAAIEALGEGLDNWATVDTYGTHLVGQAWREGRLTDAQLHGWAEDEDRWWQRAALVATVPLNLASRGGTGDPKRTLAMARRFVATDDKMLAKALSWALRQLAPVAPAATMAFLEEHRGALPKIVVRELETKLLTGKKRSSTED